MQTYLCTRVLPWSIFLATGLALPSQAGQAPDEFPARDGQHAAAYARARLPTTRRPASGPNSAPVGRSLGICTNILFGLEFGGPVAER